ncbi:hypothetical protein ASV53_02235 [Photobacterium sanguinicancri]|uniref:Uncharacterized protein n=1 Tax=Photobacterium sanguinicancri TaxID=875932 RepID=A0ABX4G3M3_9GAMM|nr:hypothetical protein ASV53_02235 [Photobacterium sanguinicancri]
MCYRCYDPEEVNWILQLSKKLNSAMSINCNEDYYPIRGVRAYITLNKKSGLLDVSYHTSQPHDSNLLSFPVRDIGHLRDIVFQIIKLGYRSLYWTNSEEVEEVCPLPPLGLARLNYYLASMSYWDGKCCTYRYLQSEISSLADRGTTSTDASTAMLLAKIPVAGD